MVQALVRGRRGLSASRIEIDREGPSYTIDTIRAMKDDCPEGLCFILGADRLLGIETWKESQSALAFGSVHRRAPAGGCLVAILWSSL